MSIAAYQDKTTRDYEGAVDNLLPNRPAPPIASEDRQWAEGLRSLPAHVLGEMLRSLRAHSLFIVIVAAHVAVAYAAPWVIQVSAPFSIDLYGDTFAVLTATALVVLAAAYVCRVMVVTRPDRLARHLWQDLSTNYITVERICSALPVFLMIPIASATFSYLKSMIPAVAPFSWDPLLADWDRVLHGGYHPWELLQPLLGHPYITFAVNLVYNLWFLVLYGVMFWQTFSIARPRLRMRFVLTLVLVWIVLGNLAAGLLSSGGPVYYGRLTGLPDPFAALMEYLRAANEILPIWAVTTQDYVWDLYVQGTFDLGSGISAMPSIHVATSFSFVLIGFATGRRLGIAFSLFAAFILIGSVHLGWHYAIDGYVSILATWLIWIGLGRLLERPFVAWLLWRISSHPPADPTPSRVAPHTVVTFRS
jgi:PAP2 superfamily